MRAWIRDTYDSGMWGFDWLRLVRDALVLLTVLAVVVLIVLAAP